MIEFPFPPSFHYLLLWPELFNKNADCSENNEALLQQIEIGKNAEVQKQSSTQRIEEPTQYRPLPAFDLLFCGLETGYINGGGGRLLKA